MDSLDFNTLNQILGREAIVAQIKKILAAAPTDLLAATAPRKCIYIYGNSGIGKTQFAIQILKECGFDYLLYDAGNIRNKAVIDDITKHNANHNNVMSMFKREKREIAIIMDEIDCMNNGDKGGINTLIKIIRQKKTKKQQAEDTIRNPIICIANYKMDKKMKELIKICAAFELKAPTNDQAFAILQRCIGATAAPDMDTIKPIVVPYIQGDLRKIGIICRLFQKNPALICPAIFSKFFHYKSYNDDTKRITADLLTHRYTIEDHNIIMNETDRTSIGLLWHENIIDVKCHESDKDSPILFYTKQLNNICFADYIDRVTFQKQIWQLTEMSSLIKTMKNNYELFSSQGTPPPHRDPAAEIRFTKVLTKYSTEYNNFLFIQKLCQQLGMDRKDLFGFFIEMKDPAAGVSLKLTNLCENYDVKKLDIQRINRYIAKYTEASTLAIEDDVEEIEEFEGDADDDVTTEDVCEDDIF